MAVTFALGRQTQNTLAYVMTHDGVADGNAVSIPNATLVADANQGGPLRAVLQRAVANNGEASAAVGGYNAAEPLTGGNPAQLYIKSRLTPIDPDDGTGPGPWHVEPIENAGVIDVVVRTATATAGTALLELELQHTEQY